MSPRPARRLRSGGSRTTFIAIAAAVVLLVVVDVVLVGVALHRTGPSDNGNPGPIPTYSSAPTPPPSATASASASASAPATPSADSTPSTSGASDVTSTVRHLSVVSATEAWRSESGTCTDDSPVLEHTTDGGSTWSPVTLAGKDVRTISAVSAGTQRTSVLAGVGSACTPTGMSTYTSGKYWAVDTTPAAGASISSTGTLVLAGGTVASPCADPVQVVQGSTATAVVCPSGLAWRTGTSGTWVIVPLSGVRSVAINGASYTIARAGLASCKGVQISRLAASGITPTSKPTVLGCAPVADATGPVTLSQIASSVWVWSGEQTLVSKDGGATW
jgi:hypothetical protein